MTELLVDAEGAGVRFDRFLRKRLSLRGLSDIYRLIRRGSARVNGRRRKESYRLQEGDRIEIELADAEITDVTTVQDASQASLVDTEYFRRQFRVLYEDDGLLVCDKPAGLVVHPGTGHLKHDTLIDLVRSHLSRTARLGAVIDPALVHRLDRDTSGVILVAKSKRLLRQLHEQLRDRAMAKRYVAVCHGRPPRNSDTIELSLERTHERNEGTKVKVVDEGRKALCSYAVEDGRGGLSRLSVDLHTGRTHQIRVLMAHIGCPILGDVRYGDRERDNALFRRVKLRGRLYLHSRLVEFHYPPLGRKVLFDAPLPEPFIQLWESLRR